MSAYAAAATANPAISDDELELTLLRAGCPLHDVRRVVQLAPLPFGRALLAGMGLRFPTDVIILSGDGEVVRTGKLVDEAGFVAATENLAFAPTLVFLDPPTEAGWAAARTLQSQHLSAKARRPWWRPW